MKILTLDIETSPHLAYTFNLRNAFIPHVAVVEPTRMICFAASFRDEKFVHFFSEYHDSRDTMVEAAWALLDEADVVVTYNGDNFDLPHIEREIRLYNKRNPEKRLLDPSPYISVDLYKVVRKNEKWASHKLAYLTEQLSLTGKLEHEGFEMWLKCLAGDAKTWNVMRRYCKRDVVTTKEVFEEYLPKIHNIPVEITDPNAIKCTCGSYRVQKRGFRRTKTRLFQQYQCQDCGHWWRDTKSVRGEAAAITS